MTFTARQRRFAAAVCTVLATSAGVTASVHAQSWPSKPVTLIVPFPAGGTTDVLARSLAEPLAKALGQPVIVESKPGAGATIGADFVAKAKPDGHTLLVGAVHHTIATSAYKKLGYDFQKSFVPITVIALVPNVLTVNAANPARTVAELVAQGKAAKEKLAFGSAGNGTVQHLIGAQFEQQSGVGLVHVPYKGSGPLTTDLLGGQIALTFDTLTPVLPHLRAGKLRALAVTTAKRSSAIPDVPTLDESGFKGFDLGTWFGLLAPAGTPKDIAARLSAESMKIIHSQDFAKRMADVGAEPVGNTPEQMAKQIRDDTEKFAPLVREAKVTIE